MKEMTAKEVEQQLNEGKKLHLIDVREAEEVAAGKIPGAIHIPLGFIEERMNELDKSKEYIMVCRSGGRSGRAVQFLESHGFKAVNMAGGMLDWEGIVELTQMKIETYGEQRSECDSGCQGTFTSNADCKTKKAMNVTDNRLLINHIVSC
jgi:rhodanese-related sulfurtransferase